MNPSQHRDISGDQHLNIRTATVEDLDQICALADEIAEFHNKNEPKVFAHADRQRDREFWRSSIVQLDGTVLVAAKATEILGFITAKVSEALAPSFLVPRKVCRIGTIIVSSQSKRQGVGTQLLRSIEAWALAQSAVETRLEVFAFNSQALCFYSNLGYATQSHIMHRSLSEHATLQPAV